MTKNKMCNDLVVGTILTTASIVLAGSAAAAVLTVGLTINLLTGALDNEHV